MIFQWAQACGEDHEQVWGKQISNQYQQNNLWPFASTPNNTTSNILKRKHTEKSNTGNNFKSNQQHTWTALIAISLFPLRLCFSPKILRNPPPRLQYVSFNASPFPIFFSPVHLSLWPSKNPHCSFVPPIRKSSKSRLAFHISLRPWRLHLSKKSFLYGSFHIFFYGQQPLPFPYGYLFHTCMVEVTL